MTSPAAARPARPARRGYLLPGVIALAALLLIGLAVGAGGDLTHPAPTTLHGSDMASQIALSVQAERGWATAPAVRCPASEPVISGLRFTCTLRTGARTQTVSVREIDRRGHLRWSLGP